MAQLYSTGPAHTFVQKGTNPPAYLGTAKISPVIEVKPSWEPVYNDLSGKVPMDMAFMGEEAMTQVELTRWNNNIYYQLAARPQSFSTQEAPGLNGPLDIGSLMLTEGLNFTFYVLFPFFRKKAYASLPAGYRFPGSYLVGPDKHQQMGTHPKELFLLFHHLRLFNPLTGQFLLYDQNVAAVLNVPLV